VTRPTQTKKVASTQLVRLLPLWLALTACLPHAIAQTRPDVPGNPFDYTRTTSAIYNANGTLQSSTIEPGIGSLCSTTSYLRDAVYGNITDTTVANCAGAVGRSVFALRTATADYDGGSQGITTNGSLVPNTTVQVPGGLFVSTSENALRQFDLRFYDQRFGVTTQVKDINGLTSSVVVDDFGRTIKASLPDGTSTLTWHCITGAGLDASSNTVIAGAGCPAPVANEQPLLAIRFTHSEARDANGAKMSAFTRTYYDKLGRAIRTSTESFDGPNQPAGRSGALIVADTVYDANGTKVMETQPYFLASGSAATGGSNSVGAALTVVDELGRTAAVYTADPNASASQGRNFGGGGPVGYGNYGYLLASSTTFAYNGLVMTTTNDKGQVRTEEKSARGDVLRVTDNTGAQIAYLPDAFGNVVKTLDALQNSVVVLYDLKGRKVEMRDPDKGVISYCFDPLGQLKSQQNSKMRGSHTAAACPEINDSGITATAVAGWTTLAYDKLGRVTQRIEPEFSSTWSYDRYAGGASCNKGAGKLCEVVTSNGVDKKIAYDNLGRELSNRTDVGGGPSFASAVSFDAVTGRLSTKTFPTGLQIGYNYSARGFLQSLSLKTAATVNPLPNAQGQVAASLNLPANSVLWQANAVDARGSIEQDRLVNNVIDVTTYEAANGHVLSATAGVNGGGTVLNHQYVWDSINNLKSRIDNNGDGTGAAVSETFGYDGLNRLAQYTVAAPAIPQLSRSVDLHYNALGMLLSKSDVGNYAYGTQGPNAPQPHALKTLNGTTYATDLNGNVTGATGGKYTQLAYTSFDNVDNATGSGAQYSWQYDENHARIRETRVSGGNTRVLWYLHPDNVGGLGFESEIDSSPATQSNRHFLSVGGKVLGVLVSTGATQALAAGQLAPTGLDSIVLNKVEYWHKDHLGSLSATTDHLGNVTQRYAYDPFGKRRYTSGRYDDAGNLVIDWSPSRNAGSGRGFTGHEELDDIGLVNMNGRLYDDTAGLFIQADPNVTNPLNLQNYNRYGYVLNNPLNATDPSGFDTNGKEYRHEGGDPQWDAWKEFLRTLSSIANAFGGSSAGTAKSDGSGSDGQPGDTTPQSGDKNGGGAGNGNKPSKPSPFSDCSRESASWCQTYHVNDAVTVRAEELRKERKEAAAATAAEFDRIEASAIDAYQKCGSDKACISDSLGSMVQLRRQALAAGIPFQERRGINVNIAQAAMLLGAEELAMDAIGAAGIVVMMNQSGGGAKAIPGRGYHIEKAAPQAIKATDVTRRWEEFLGPGPYTNIHPRTGAVDADRIVSADGMRSIRYGAHEMSSAASKHHYHEETWTYDPGKNVVNVDNTMVRIRN
jgi:RHS repeat-associated protein